MARRRKAPEVSTRRALEVVLSRVSMVDDTKDDLVSALSQIIMSEEFRETEPLPITDPERARGYLECIDHYARGVHSDFPKRAMLTRLELVRDICRAAKRDLTTPPDRRD